MSGKHTRSMYGFTKNGNNTKANVHYIKYCKILRKVIKEAKKHHYNKLVPGSNNNMKHYKKRDKKSIFSGTGSHRLVTEGKLKDSADMAGAFKRTITEKLNIQQIAKGGTISVLKNSFPGLLPA